MTDRTAIVITAMILTTITDITLLVGACYLCAFKGWSLGTVPAAALLTAVTSWSLKEKTKDEY